MGKLRLKSLKKKKSTEGIVSPGYRRAARITESKRKPEKSKEVRTVIQKGFAEKGDVVAEPGRGVRTEARCRCAYTG